MLYSAKFGRGYLDGTILAGGSGKRPVVKVFQAVGGLNGCLPACAGGSSYMQCSHLGSWRLPCCSSMFSRHAVWD